MIASISAALTSFAIGDVSFLGGQVTGYELTTEQHFYGWKDSWSTGGLHPTNSSATRTVCSAQPGVRCLRSGPGEKFIGYYMETVHA